MGGGISVTAPSSVPEVRFRGLKPATKLRDGGGSVQRVRPVERAWVGQPADCATGSRPQAGIQPLQLAHPCCCPAVRGHRGRHSARWPAVERVQLAAPHHAQQGVGGRARMAPPVIAGLPTSCLAVAPSLPSSEPRLPSLPQVACGHRGAAKVAGQSADHAQPSRFFGRQHPRLQAGPIGCAPAARACGAADNSPPGGDPV